MSTIAMPQVQGVTPLGQSGLKPRTAPAPAMPAMQGFGATNNLIGQQINPTNSGMTNAATGLTMNAANNYANQTFTPFSLATQKQGLTDANTQMQGVNLNFSGANQNYGNAQSQLAGAAGQAGAMLTKLGQQTNFGGGTAQADTTRFGADLDSALAGLNGPDRAALAAQSFGLLEQRSQPGFEMAMRNVNAKNAAMGRRGSGITTNELGDVTLARERELALAKQQLSGDAAAQTLNDRLAISNQQLEAAKARFAGEQTNASLADRGLDRNTQAAQFGANFGRSVAGDIYGMGRDGADLSMSIGDRSGQQARDIGALGERKARFGSDTAMNDAQLSGVERGDEFDRANFGRGQFSDFSSFLSNRESQDRSNRNELRDERGYQYGLSRDAIGDEYDRMNWEETVRNNRFNRGMGTANLGFGEVSPSGAYGAAGANAGAQSADGYGGMAQLLAMYGQQQRRTPSGTSR